MIPFWCACCTPSQTARNRSIRSGIASLCLVANAVIVWPCTYSMAKYGRPCGVAPASNTRAMAGWSIKASACRSASNRATTCTVSIPALITFNATCRRTGRVCSASQTSPIPPWPTRSRRRYGPMVSVAETREGCARVRSGLRTESSTGRSLMATSHRKTYYPTRDPQDRVMERWRR